MADTNQAGTRRARRSTEASRRLARARERNLVQLADQRDAEKRVDAALREYVAAGEKIAEAEHILASKLAEQDLVRQRLTEQAEQKVAGQRDQQVRAALTIHESGRTIEQVADLLEVSVKAARALIAAGRQIDDPASQPDTADDAVGNAVRQLDPPTPATRADSASARDEVNRNVAPVAPVARGGSQSGDRLASATDRPDETYSAAGTTESTAQQ
jgi:flagellar biosynthesis chaperone FliJ